MSNYPPAVVRWLAAGASPPCADVAALVKCTWPDSSEEFTHAAGRLLQALHEDGKALPHAADCDIAQLLTHIIQFGLAHR
ncbi:hypothetical protein SAMN05445060_2367 [Williamsia sterculiae]|uniref:Uncharacterized protein n=1 Tax=Williamsia sterculiae TaxID=1344003 RepID=A0A1N7FXF0_9NOCA|nr:hypothetical protein SAMN05445060_2367 [Williamsia sterculiae]